MKGLAGFFFCSPLPSPADFERFFGRPGSAEEVVEGRGTGPRRPISSPRRISRPPQAFSLEEDRELRKPQNFGQQLQRFPPPAGREAPAPARALVARAAATGRRPLDVPRRGRAHAPGSWGGAGSRPGSGGLEGGLGRRCPTPTSGRRGRGRRGSRTPSGRRTMWTTCWRWRRTCGTRTRTWRCRPRRSTSWRAAGRGPAPGGARTPSVSAGPGRTPRPSTRAGTRCASSSWRSTTR